MHTLVEIIINSGETAINLALYLILPILVVMMAVMRVLENKGVLGAIAAKLSPILAFFGLPGLGVFALLQVQFISFAAPIATFKIMEYDKHISNRQIAATLAAVLVMSQGNAILPLAVVGLNMPIIILTSIIGGLIAAYLAYRFHGEDESDKLPQEEISVKDDKEVEKKKIISLLFRGGEEGLEIAKKSIVPLILALFMVNILREINVIDFLEKLLAPALTRVGIPGVAILPIATKYIAGGTAMMAIVMDLISEGSMTAVELNRIAGFSINPLDPVGVALLISAGTRVASVTKPAFKAAIIGIVLRGIIHLVIF
ncbi:nucleoside recognition family protein [Clostridium sp. D2Q-11]|uniref:Nucleoside recognition family protein n=1 Tax=Anaeromonas frigoriresistens TaxID=2683708 RepID=A0A942UVV5_9FIRM|nr:nucleoside recognition family protein [Anaeromonas frigoriresistens]MBS4537376.1 nucleoside recognition family protein [Anaeromonas frigoriresistens]